MSSLQQALALHRAGQAAAALSHYTQALIDAPDDLAALYYGGVAAWSSGDYELALQRLDRVVALAPQPNADVHYHRALVHANLGARESAVNDYRRAIELKPNFAPALNNLAELLRAQRGFAEAELLFRRALVIEPTFHDARFNRGLNAHQAGDLPLAKAELSLCVKQDPDNLRARATLIAVLIDLTAQSEALALARASAKRYPASSELWNALAEAEHAAGNIDAARSAFASGLALDASNKTLALNAAFLEHENANTERAREIYAHARTQNASSGIDFRLATLLPTIAESEMQIDAARTEFLHAVDSLRERGATLDDPLNEFGDTPFYLSYHGRDDDRVLLGALSRALRAAAPVLDFCADHVDRKRRAGKWRVGFLSHFLFDQSVGRSMHAFIGGLPRDRFDVHVLRASPFFDDSLAKRMDVDATAHRLPADLVAAQRAVAAIELDALIFPEIGMDALTYYLAQARLARIQWTTFGHPCTSGLDTINSYLSFAALEPKNNERFYRESLIRLPEGAIYPDYPSVALPS
ncbi:MAG: tetratricopeptide repeat protein, partial [Casimicrobium sp.]